MKTKLRLVTPEFVEEYFAEKRGPCDRVKKRIECLNCGYPASESYYYLYPDLPGIASGPSGVVIQDPGCKYEFV